MKKIIWLIFLILILSSCWEEPCQTKECFEAKIQLEKFESQQRKIASENYDKALEKKPENPTHAP